MGGSVSLQALEDSTIALGNKSLSRTSFVDLLGSAVANASLFDALRVVDETDEATPRESLVLASDLAAILKLLRELRSKAAADKAKEREELQGAASSRIQEADRALQALRDEEVAFRKELSNSEKGGDAMGECGETLCGYT